MEQVFERWQRDCFKTTELKLTTTTSEEESSNDDNNAAGGDEKEEEREEQAVATVVVGRRGEASQYFASLRGGEEERCDDQKRMGATTTSTIMATTTITGNTTTHERALAALIQALGPPLNDDNLSCRRNALLVLVGALEGTATVATAPTSATAAAASASLLSMKTLELLGTFFLQHAGPITAVDQKTEGEQEVRDAAVLGLTCLLRCSRCCRGNSSSSVNRDVGEEEEEDVSMILLSCLDWSVQGVQRRCAAPELDDDIVDIDDNDHHHRASYSSGYESTFDERQQQQQGNATVDYYAGLSTLPRSKRSLCFELLGAAVRAVAEIIATTTGASSTTTGAPVATKNKKKDAVVAVVVERMIAFTKFAARCLRGESDPRCLLQLLRILDAAAKTFAPYFYFYFDFVSTTTTSSSSFPMEDVFDAVAPYYPIQFSPPPNNVHGITRRGLCGALLRVLCMDKYFDRGNGTTMLPYSIGLILEQLPTTSTSSIDNNNAHDSTSISEMLETVRDLAVVLQLSVSGSNDKNNNYEEERWHENDDDDDAGAATSLDAETVRQLSQALRAVHERACDRAAAATATTAAQDAATASREARDAKELAELCRRLIARVAFACERGDSSNDNGNDSSSSLWEAFVGETLESLHLDGATLEASSGSRKRHEIAHAAILCSAGGPKTLRRTLARALPALLDNLTRANNGKSANDNDATTDDMVITTSCQGIGVLFSSTSVALDRVAARDGIVMHPHPLQPYGAKAVERLCRLIFNYNNNLNKTQHTGTSGAASAPAAPSSAAAAALRALDPVVAAVPVEQLTPVHTQALMEVVDQMMMTLAILDGSNEQQQGQRNDKNKEWVRANVQTLSRFLAMAAPSSSSAAEDQEQRKQQQHHAAQVDPLRTALETHLGSILAKTAASSTSNSSAPTPATSCGQQRASIVLARVCSMSGRAADRIVKSLVGSLYNALLLARNNNSNGNDDKSALTSGGPSAGTPAAVTAVGGVLRAVLCHGGSNATRAYFHHLRAPDAKVTPLDVLKVLATIIPPENNHHPSNRAATAGGNNNNNNNGESASAAEATIGMSQLQLPPTSEERASTLRAIEYAHAILPFVRPAYQLAAVVPIGHLQELVAQVSKVLPPLCEADTVKLAVYLPILSAALEQQRQEKGVAVLAGDDDEKDSAAVLNKIKKEMLPAMLADLAEFALTSEYHALARSHAGATLHHAVAQSTNENSLSWSSRCPVRELMRCVVVPHIRQAMQQPQLQSAGANNAIADTTSGSGAGAKTQQQHLQRQQRDGAVAAITDCLMLSAVLGSAAAQRRCGVLASSATADGIVRFLGELACQQRTDATIAFESDDSATSEGGEIDLTVFDWTNLPSSASIATELSVAAANAFGSLLSTLGDGGGDCGSLWKQRLAHIAAKHVADMIDKNACKEEGEEEEDADDDDDDDDDDDTPRKSNKSSQPLPPLGTVVATCHVICCCSLKAISNINSSGNNNGNGKPAGALALFARVIIAGALSPTFFKKRQLDDDARTMRSIQKLVLAAVVKLLCVAPPDLVAPHLYLIITGVLCSYAARFSSSSSDDDTDDDYRRDDDDNDHNVACKLLALQALQAASRVHHHHQHGEGGGAHQQKTAAVVSAVKPAIVSILESAMNDPSSALRHAAVEVRNAWFLVAD